MPNYTANPTPITPPRVALIDPRTGLIERSWYMFFLSLFTIAQGADDLKTAPDANSLLASYDAALQALAQFAETQPLGSAVELESVVDALRQELQTSNSSTINQIAELRKQIEGLQVTPPPREFKRARYGQFLDTTTQTAAAINTPYAITYNTTDISNGVYLGSPSSRIYVDEAAVYNFIFSVELDKTSGGTANFWIWPSINGTDVPNSASQVQIQGNDAELFTAAGFFLNLSAGDYVEFKFAVSDTSVQLAAFASTTFHPAIPSIIVTVTDNIQGVQ